jgi:hypothetical protein
VTTPVGAVTLPTAALDSIVSRRGRHGEFRYRYGRQSGTYCGAAEAVGGERIRHPVLRRQGDIDFGGSSITISRPTSSGGRGRLGRRGLVLERLRRASANDLRLRRGDGPCNVHDDAPVLLRRRLYGALVEPVHRRYFRRLVLRRGEVRRAEQAVQGDDARRPSRRTPP